MSQTQAILDGRQPRDLTADKLLAHSRLPLTWDEQRTVLGFARCQQAVRYWRRCACKGFDPQSERFARDSALGQAGFELVWGFSCQAVVLGCADSFLFGARKAVFRPVACNQVRGARGRGQGTETLAEFGGLPP